MAVQLLETSTAAQLLAVSTAAQLLEASTAAQLLETSMAAQLLEVNTAAALPDTVAVGQKMATNSHTTTRSRQRLTPTRLRLLGSTQTWDTQPGLIV